VIAGHLAGGKLDAQEGVREALPAPLAELRGPFALAVWDGATLTLARDRFGQRPLFYAQRGGEVWFASTIQRLRALGAPLGQIDRDALSDFLELSYVPAPASIWSGARKLPAGHLLRAGEHGVEVRRWFELPVPGAAEKRPSRISLRARLEEAAKRADPSACVVLSGDLGSSALLGLMTRKHGRVKSIGGPDPIARRVAERFRSAHSEAALNSVEQLPRLLANLSEPLGDPALIETAAMLEAAGSNVLSAVGSDELFAGHLRYIRAARLPHSGRAGRAAGLVATLAPRRHRGRLQRAASAIGTSGAARARALVEIFSLEERRALLGTHARTAEGATSEVEGNADAAVAFDLEVALPDGILAGLEAAAARAGVEVQAPFLDPSLAGLAVPPAARHKLGRAHGARMLRDAVADLLPRDVLAADPRPPPPVAAWLRGPLRPLMHDLLLSPSARIRALLDPRAIDEMLRHSLLPRGDPRQAWALLALEMWVRENRPQASGLRPQAS
jgi:asparagine synthase (glutamine-hydrolysing)